MRDDTLSAACALLPGHRLDHPAELRRGPRAVVHRVRATSPDGSRRSVVVKRFTSAGEGWVREAAALAMMPAGAGAARLVAAGSEPPIIVLEDLGSGPSVADALLGKDPAAAESAVLAWVAALAAVHGATRGARSAFRAALDERQGDLPVDDEVWTDLEQTVRVLDNTCASLSVTVPTGALDELRGVADRLSAGPLAALTPADTCPDNNVRRDDGLHLVDWEGAQWRHVAWDVAYLRVPWPTCWCSWRLPRELADRAVDAYREAAAAAFPEVAGEAFAADVEVAACAWSVITAMRSVERALGSDARLEPSTRPTPTRRALVGHRLGEVAASSQLPRLAELAAGLLAELQRRWGETPLAFAPAFRDRTGQ